MKGRLLALVLAFAPAPAAAQQAATAPPGDVPVVACGLAHRRLISYAGGQLRARPVDARTTALQVTVEPGDGLTSWNLEIVGFEEGSFDAAEYLEHADGTPASGLPGIPVRIVSLLPPGVHLDLETTARAPAAIAGRPSWLWPVLAALWVAVPAAWFIVRRARQGRARAAEPPPVERIVDPLDELVGLVGQRPLTITERARLELLVLRRLGEASVGSFGSNGNPYLLARGEPGAASIVDALESWLHHPRPAAEVEQRLVEALRRLPRAAADERAAAGAAP